MGALHLLSDNENISRDQYLMAAELIEAIRRIHADAEAHVRDHALDPRVFLPGGVWSRITGENKFLNWTYDLVNYAKFVSPSRAPFTGFDLTAWGWTGRGDIDDDKLAKFHDEFRSSGRAPEFFQDFLDKEFNLSKRMASNYDVYVDTYKTLTAGVPEKYRLKLPPRAGEIGLLHDGFIINPDVISYQSRMNALIGSGVIETLEKKIQDNGVANYLEIGPGHCFFSYALRACLGEKLNVFLIDIPLIMANGCAYLSCAAGADTIGVVSGDTNAAVQRPFVFIPNYLTEHYRKFLPGIDLVHNAISLNEMNNSQIDYYNNLISDIMSPDGVFHLYQGGKYSPGHEDALAAACRKFRKFAMYEDNVVNGYRTLESPSTFFYKNTDA